MGTASPVGAVSLLPDVPMIVIALACSFTEPHIAAEVKAGRLGQA